MPRLPILSAPPQTRDVADVFRGYRHRLKLDRGELYDTRNLSTGDWPMLATRKRRGMVRRLQQPQGLLAKDKLCWVDGGTLYYGGEATPVTGLSAGHKQLVSLGAAVCVFPDKVYYNTQDPADWGSMEFHRTLAGPVRYALCTASGEDLGCASGPVAPAEPAEGDFWYDSAAGQLKVYSAARESWSGVDTVYTRISFPEPGFSLADQLKVHDGVELRGTAFPEELDGVKILYAVGADYLVVAGRIDGAAEAAGSVSLSRELPDLDYVCECQNRLWGCFYGRGRDGSMHNEICCCALGDFKNWRQYLGLSTDSWTASVGSDGPWTGAVNYLGCPIFFKENRSHRVVTSAAGAHSIRENVERGVQQGSWRSLAISDETLYWKSRGELVAYQGGFPAGISEALGDAVYSEAVGGTFASRYYVSMRDGEGCWSLFVYDSRTGLWVREDDLHLTDLAPLGDSLYALDADGLLWDLAGAAGEKEKRLPWMAQSGVLYYTRAAKNGGARFLGKEYVSRFEIMLSAPAGTEVRLYLQYDSDGLWRPCGGFRFKGLNSVTLPVRPRRCDHLELRIEGEGDVKIFSVARILEQGGEE